MNLILIIIACVFLILFGIQVFLIFLIYKQNQPMSNYPLPVYHFIVEWGGSRIGFTEVSGLDIFFEPIKYREGVSPVESSIKMPGLIKYNNITLKRGIVKGDNEFMEWMKTKQMNTIERRDIVIKLLDEEHKPIITWKVHNAFPVRYSGPVLNSNSNEVAIEVLEVAHEGIEVMS
jgi:phage tail-like protein